MQAPAAALQSNIVSKANGTAIRLTATDLPTLIIIGRFHGDNNVRCAEFPHQTVGVIDRYDRLA